MENGCILELMLLCDGPVQNRILIMLVVSFSLKRHPLEVIPTPYQGMSILRLEFFFLAHVCLLLNRWFAGL